jgi:hypothetical protein
MKKKSVDLDRARLELLSGFNSSRWKDRPATTDIRLGLEGFIHHIRDVGSISIRSEIPDDETKAMLRTQVTKLIEASPELIRLIETWCKPEREYALTLLWTALAAAYQIGYAATSEENAAAVKRERGRKANRSSVARRRESPTSKNIRSVVDRHYRPGDEKRSDRMGRTMMDDVNRLQKAAGLPLLKRPDRIAREIKRRAKSPRC